MIFVDTDLHTYAIERDASLATADHDFARFPGLRLAGPFVGR